MSDRAGLMVYVVSIVVLVFIDQIFKYLAFNYLENYSLIPGIVSIVRTANPGLIFGLGAGSLIVRSFHVLLLIMEFAGIACLFVYMKQKSSNKTMIALYLVFVLSGFIGNSSDRIMLGYVRDYIRWFESRTVNLSDLYLAVGMIAFLVGLHNKRLSRVSAAAGGSK